VQPFLGSDGDAALLGHRHKISQVSKLHGAPCLSGMPHRHTKSFCSGQWTPRSIVIGNATADRSTSLKGS
jgi:hypothetical protein